LRGHLGCRDNVAGGINYLVSESKWTGLQSNRGAWTVILLSRKSFILIDDYSFLSSCKCSILKIDIRAKVTS